MNNDPISDAEMQILIEQYRWLKQIHTDGLGALSFSISITDSEVRIASAHFDKNIKYPINKDTIFAFERAYPLEGKKK